MSKKKNLNMTHVNAASKYQESNMGMLRVKI